jgi:hypothetical protein
MSDTSTVDVGAILARLDCDPPITVEALTRLVAHIELTYETPLPNDYVDFLRTADGADGTLDNGIPIALWSAEVLPEANLLDGSLWLPGCLIIGSDTGDTVYAIDMRENAPPERYLESEDVGLDWDYIFWRGPSFADLLAHLSAPIEPPRKRGLRGFFRRR